MMRLGGRRQRRADGLVRAGVLVAALILTSVGSAAVYAYNNADNVPCRWPYAGGGNLLYMRWANHPTFPPSGTYATAFSDARSAWNGSATPVYFTTSGTVNTYHGMDNQGPNGTFGLMQPLCSGSTFVQAAVIMNPGNFTGSYNTAFWKKYTAVHETGHSVSLGHSTVLPTVMRRSIPPASFQYDLLPAGGYNYPMADDLCGVNHMYSSTSWPPACGY